MEKRIVIIGAGISGMSTAFLLSGKGYRITICAAAFSPDITSNRAAAFWFPYHIRNDKRGIDWCRTSYRYYTSFTATPETGISMRQLKKVVRKGVTEEEPVWVQFMPEGSYKISRGAQVEDGIDTIYDVTVPLIETQLFLPWLQQQLIEKGVEFKTAKIDNLDALANEYDLVINCSALGARELCKDEALIPVRGQVALLEPIADMPIYLDNEKLLYVVPRKDAIIVGGTYEAGVETETTEPETLERLLYNAREVLPALKNQQVTGSWAGLRPYRAEVRVELEEGKNILHNYGHGGSGFTLAFGCADTICKLVTTML